MPRRVSFGFHGARSVGQSTVTLLPCSCGPAQRSARWLVSKRSSVLRWGQLAPASRFATSAAALAGRKGESPQLRPVRAGKHDTTKGPYGRMKAAGLQELMVPTLPGYGKADDTYSRVFPQHLTSCATETQGMPPLHSLPRHVGKQPPVVLPRSMASWIDVSGEGWPPMLAMPPGVEINARDELSRKQKAQALRAGLSAPVSLHCHGTGSWLVCAPC